MVIDQHGQKVDYVANENEDGKRLTTFTVTCCPEEK